MNKDDRLCKYFNKQVERSVRKALLGSVPDGKTLRLEVRDDRGRRHNLSGPAVLSATDTTLTAEWYRNGRRHRDGGPAILVLERSTGICIKEGWLSHGRLHRELYGTFRAEDAAAVIFRKEGTGAMWEFLFYHRGRLWDSQRPARGPYLFEQQNGVARLFGLK